VLKRAVEALVAGRPVVIPTDTVYGIAALPEVPGAVDAIFRAKGRPEEKPLPVLAAGVEDLVEVAVLDDRARKLADRFWPGPLTIVLARTPGFTHDLGGGEKDTVGVRVPAYEIALELLGYTGPLAVTSANRSGDEPATTVTAARAALGSEVEVYVDGGVCNGASSTVVSLVSELQILREGPVTLDEIDQTLTP
jgi:L-threonylcarbamoyladenylate synthase